MNRQHKHIVMRVFFAIALFLPVWVSAQTTSYGDFRLVNTEVVYQKVFDRPSVTLEELDSLLRSSAGVSDVTLSEGSISAKLTELVVDYRKFKFQIGRAPGR